LCCSALARFRRRNSDGMCRHCSIIGKAMKTGIVFEKCKHDRVFVFVGQALEDPIAAAYLGDTLALALPAAADAPISVEVLAGSGPGDKITVAGKTHVVPAGAVAGDMLKLPAGGAAKTLIAVHVTGDGNCLAHAVSRSLYGTEQFYAVIRLGLARELEDNKAWYLETMGGENGTLTVEEFAELLKRAGDDGTLGQSLSTTGAAYLDAGDGLHLLGLANLLHRPIMLLGAQRHIRGAGRELSLCTTYLPTRRDSADPKLCKAPVLVAWQSPAFETGAGHFVCVAPTSHSDKPVRLPLQCVPDVPPYQAEVDATQYLNYDEEGCVLLPRTAQQAWRWTKTTGTLVEHSYSGGPHYVEQEILGMQLGVPKAELPTMLVPANACSQMSASMVVKLCHEAEQDVFDFLRRTDDLTGVQVEAESSLALFLRLYAYELMICDICASQRGRSIETAGWETKTLHAKFGELKDFCQHGSAHSQLHPHVELLARLDLTLDQLMVQEFKVFKVSQPTYRDAVERMEETLQKQILRKCVPQQRTLREARGDGALPGDEHDDFRPDGRGYGTCTMLRSLVADKDLVQMDEQNSRWIIAQLQDDVEAKWRGSDEAILVEQLADTSSGSSLRDEKEITRDRVVRTASGTTKLVADDEPALARTQTEPFQLVKMPATQLKAAGAAQSQREQFEGVKQKLQAEHTQLHGLDDDDGEEDTGAEHSFGRALSTLPLPGVLLELEKGGVDPQRLGRTLSEQLNASFDIVLGLRTVTLEATSSVPDEIEEPAEDEMITVFICSPTNSFAIELLQSSTVAELKALVLEQTSRDQELVLVHNAMTLDDSDVCISEYEIAQMSQLSIGQTYRPHAGKARQDIIMFRKQIQSQIRDMYEALGMRLALPKGKLYPERTTREDFTFWVQKERARTGRLQKDKGMVTDEKLRDMQLAVEELMRSSSEVADEEEAATTPDFEDAESPPVPEATAVAVVVAPTPTTQPAAQSQPTRSEQQARSSPPPSLTAAVTFRFLVADAATGTRNLTMNHSFSKTAPMAEVYAWVKQAAASANLQGIPVLSTQDWPPKIVSRSELLCNVGVLQGDVGLLKVELMPDELPTSPDRRRTPTARGGSLYEECREQHGELSEHRRYTLRGRDGRNAEYVYDAGADELQLAPEREDTAAADVAAENADAKSEMAQKLLEGFFPSKDLVLGGRYYDEALSMVGCAPTASEEERTQALYSKLPDQVLARPQELYVPTGLKKAFAPMLGDAKAVLFARAAAVDSCGGGDSGGGGGGGGAVELLCEYYWLDSAVVLQGQTTQPQGLLYLIVSVAAAWGCTSAV